MKQKNLITAVFILSAFTLKAADQYVSGYIITKTNDTVQYKILMPKDYGRFDEQLLFSQVSVMDSVGTKKTFKPGEISGYSFTYHAKKYVYLSKKTNSEGKTLFVWPRNLGKKINEYYYYSLHTSALPKGSTGSLSEVYLLEDPQTLATVAITRGGAWTDNFKQQLNKLFENDKNLLKLIAKEVNDFHDVPLFVQDANRQ